MQKNETTPRLVCVLLRVGEKEKNSSLEVGDCAEDMLA